MNVGDSADSACNMFFCLEAALHMKDTCSEGMSCNPEVLKAALHMKCFFFSTLLQLYDACSYKVIVGASETPCQISLKLMFISESMFVTSHKNKHNHTTEITGIQVELLF